MGIIRTTLNTTSLALAGGLVLAGLAHHDDPVTNNDGEISTDQSEIIDWDMRVKNPVPFFIPPLRPQQIGDRRTISASEANYNGVGRILLNGRNHCTGNIVEIEGYQPREDGILVSTAAHCVDEDANSQNLTFSINFLNSDGALEYAAYTNPEIWHNPSYVDTHIASASSNDQALMFFPHQSLADEVKPSLLTVFSRHIERDFGTYEWQDVTITSAGYSQDMDGLSTDENCHIKSVQNNTHFPYLVADCSLNKGASGSGLLTNNFNGEQTIGAITSAKSTDIEVTDESFRSYLSMMYHANLAAIPFLEKDEICAQVTAPNGLHVRTDDYNDPNSAYASLAFNEVVLVTDMLEDEQEKYGADDVWIQIRTLDNPDPQTPNGYSNSVWLTAVPCPTR